MCIFICAGKAVFNGTFGNSSCIARGELYVAVPGRNRTLFHCVFKFDGSS